MRGCLSKILALAVGAVMVATWLGTPATAAAHDVERDGQTSSNVMAAYPFIGNVSGFNRVGGGIEIVLNPHGRALGRWQCSGLGYQGPIYTYNNSSGNTPRTISVEVPEVSSTTYPGAMEPGEMCWYVVQAVNPSGDNTNAFPPQPFDITDAYWWGDIPGDGAEDPDPEPTPTPTPTPGPTPTPTPVVPDFSCEARVGPLYGITKPGVCEVSLTPGIYTAVYKWTEDIGLNDQTISLRESDGGSLVPGCSTGSATYTGESVGVETECTGLDTSNITPDGLEIQITYASHNNASSGGKATLDVYCTGGACTPTPTPTPEPTPSPTPVPSPTPLPPGSYPPPPSNGGFDVCDSQYSASEKSMCQPHPSFPEEVGVDECEGADDASLAGCQPVEPWEGPEGGSGGAGPGYPVGGGTGDSGLAECEPTPVEQKVGYVAPLPATTVDDLAVRVEGKDPLAGLGEALGWIGDMIASLPAHGVNVAYWLWNQVIDALVPGDCLGAIVASHWEGMLDTMPLSLFADAKDAIDSAIGGAGTIAIPGVPLPGGGSIAFPMDEWESHVAPYRGVMGAAVYLGGFLYVFRVVAGTFGVAKGPEQLTLGL